jgi:aerobic carbon-monoxide dehydrogenase large subunit
VGEGGLIGAPASIINAVVDALSPFGVEIFEIPASPQRILDHIRRMRTT